MKKFAILSFLAVSAAVTSSSATPVSRDAATPGYLQMSFLNKTTIGFVQSITSYGIFGNPTQFPSEAVQFLADPTYAGTQNFQIVSTVIGYTSGPYLGITTPASQSSLSSGVGYGHLTGSSLTADSSPPTAYVDSWSNPQSSESQVWIIDPSTSKIHPKWTNSDSSTFEDFTVSWKPYGVSSSAGTITFVTSLGAVPSYEFPIELTFVAA